MNELNPRDLLAASQTCKYWRDVSLPVIAESFYIKLQSMGQAKSILSNTSVRYKHFLFVSFLLLKCRFIYIWTVNTNVMRVNLCFFLICLFNKISLYVLNKLEYFFSIV